jgi:hypothetical protein
VVAVKERRMVLKLKNDEAKERPIILYDGTQWTEMTPEQWAEYLKAQKDAKDDARTARECTAY